MSLMKEVCEGVLDIAFENMTKIERVKRKKKYVKNKSVSKKIKKISLKRFVRNRADEAIRIFKLATSAFKKLRKET